MFRVLSTKALLNTVLRSGRHWRVNTSKQFASKVPEHPTWQPADPRTSPEVPVLDDAMIEHLERLSLVEFSNKEGVDRLRSAIEYANQLHVVDTEGVKPMYSVLEDRQLLLEEDKVGVTVPRSEVLQNATMVEEDYFVAPPGNIPLTKDKGNQLSSDNSLTKDKGNQLSSDNSLTKDKGNQIKTESIQ